MDSASNLDELVADWTLVGDELDLVAGKSGATRLGFALQVKFDARNGRFLVDRNDVSNEVVDYVGRQVGIETDALKGYDWSSRAVRFHPSEIRGYFGFRECSTEDAQRAGEWLTEHVCERERDTAVVTDELLAWFRREQVEPPTAGRIDRLVRSALHRGELALTARVGDACQARFPRGWIRSLPKHTKLEMMTPSHHGRRC